MEYDPERSFFTPETFMHLCDVRLLALRAMQKAITEEWDHVVQARVAASEFLVPSPQSDQE